MTPLRLYAVTELNRNNWTTPQLSFQREDRGEDEEGEDEDEQEDDFGAVEGEDEDKDEKDGDVGDADGGWRGDVCIVDGVTFSQFSFLPYCE